MLELLRSLALAALLLAPLQPAHAWQDSHSPALAENAAPSEDAEISRGPPSFEDANPVIQDYDPDPAIWRLADEDTTLYFFGTVHALPEGFRWRSALLEEVIAKSEEIVFESRSDEYAEDSFQDTMMQMWDPSPEKTPISERLSEANRPKWRKLADLAELNFTLFDAMPPSMSLLFIGVATSDMRGSKGEYGVETVLEREFKAAGKPMYAIEDPSAVMRSVLDLDEELAIETLEGALSQWDGVDLAGFEPDMTGYDWRLEHLWALGIEDPQGFESWMADPFSQALYKVLLADRNAQWTDWIIDRMDRPGTVLIAVGGGHFEGPDAVQRMLAEKGYDVERLNPPTNEFPSQLVEYSEN